MSSKSRWIVVIACASLAACNTTYTHISDESPVFGEAEKYDQAMQTVNPVPVYGPDSAQPGSNGDVGAHAVKRYRTDTVKPVVLESSSESGSGMGSSSPH